MSPLEIIVLLHYHGCIEDIADMDAPAVQTALQRFVDLGLLIRSSDLRGGAPLSGDPLFRAGPGVDVYVSALQAVPLPVQQWVIPQQGG